MMSRRSAACMFYPICLLLALGGFSIAYFLSWIVWRLLVVVLQAGFGLMAQASTSSLSNLSCDPFPPDSKKMFCLLGYLAYFKSFPNEVWLTFLVFPLSTYCPSSLPFCLVEEAYWMFVALSTATCLGLCVGDPSVDPCSLFLLTAMLMGNSPSWLLAEHSTSDAAEPTMIF